MYFAVQWPAANFAIFKTTRKHPKTVKSSVRSLHSVAPLKIVSSYTMDILLQVPECIWVYKSHGSHKMHKEQKCKTFKLVMQLFTLFTTCLMAASALQCPPMSKYRLIQLSSGFSTKLTICERLAFTQLCQKVARRSDIPAGLRKFCSKSAPSSVHGRVGGWKNFGARRANYRNY